MEKRKIIGLSLLGVGTVGMGLAAYPLINSIILDHNSKEAKAKESSSVASVVNNVYGSTEKAAKDKIMTSALIAGGALGIGLLSFIAGGVLLTPLGLKLAKAKYAKMLAIAGGAVAAISPILGVVSIPVHIAAMNSKEYQQAKQFIDFSKQFETVFMDNINSVEDTARDMLDKSEWLAFKDLMVKFDGSEGALAFKISDADKAVDENTYFYHSFLIAANMYVLAGQGLLDGTAGNSFTNLKSANYFTDKAWWGKHTEYFDRLNEIKTIRNKFMPDNLGVSIADNQKISTLKLDELETQAVGTAAKKTVDWFKNFMKSYHSDFGDKATDEVIAITLAKLAYVSGNKDLSILGAGANDADGKAWPVENGIQVLAKSTGMPTLTHGKATLANKFMIPAKLAHFANVDGLVLVGDHFELKEKLASSIGIDELTKVYKPSWLNDPIKYIFTEPGANRVKLDATKLHEIAQTNPYINEDFLKPYFEGHEIYIDANAMMVQFKDLDDAVTQGLAVTSMAASFPAGSLPGLVGSAKDAPIMEVFRNVLLNAKEKAGTPPFPAKTTQSAASYFVQMKLGLAKNYVQSVMNEISDTLTNHADDIYK